MKLPFEVELSDKVIAITGAGGVICGEFARALAASGAKVALLDINFDAAKKIADEIGENAVAVRCNCLDKASIVAAKEEVNAAFGKVNFLINGAGGNNPRATTDNETAAEAAQKDFFALDESGIKFVFDLNITTAFLVTQVFAADMLETGGNIINISSMSAHLGFSEVVPYCTSKGAVLAMTRGLAVEWANDNVMVNSIAPGWFPSEMNKQVMDAERKQKILSRMPVHKFGDTRDIGAMALFLVSDGAKYITGQDYAVDGGALAFGY